MEQHWITVSQDRARSYVVVTGRLGLPQRDELEHALQRVVATHPAALLVELDVESLPDALVDTLADAIGAATKAACQVRIGVLRPDLKERLDGDGRFPEVHLVEG